MADLIFNLYKLAQAIGCMINYHKYLPVSQEDKKWGLYVLNAGFNQVQPEAPYPAPGHPALYAFNWNQGRVLDEFQLIYIAKGEGVFESRSCSQTEVKEGTVLLLFPGEWHRYRPDPLTGWEEWWVGFEGEVVRRLVQQELLSRHQPVWHVGLQESIVHLLEGIIEKTKGEKPGYQPAAAGAVLHLLGEVHAYSRQEALKAEDVSEALVNKARVILRTHVEENISLEQVAQDLQVSYSRFRKAFKKYTGMAPGQYLIQLKIEKAKQLLAYPAKSVKEIAFDLGFESAHYFSKIFKMKMGQSPELYRKGLQQED